MPIFDVAPFLEEFLDSLIRQELQDFEAVLVDDGSTDASAEIGAAWASRDDRFRLHRFANGGLGRARNRGLEMATGDYVAFADPDDLVLPRGYRRLVEALAASGAPVATAPALQFVDGATPHAESPRYWTTAGDMWDRDRSVAGVAEEPRLVLDHTAWNKVFRRTELQSNGFTFPVDTTCEDVLPVITTYLRARHVDIVAEPVYAHRRRAASITSGILSDRVVLDWVRQTSAVLDEISEASEAVRACYSARMLRDEAWTRVAEVDAGLSVDASEAVAAFARRLHQAAPESVVCELDARRRLYYRAMEPGARHLLADVRAQEATQADHHHRELSAENDRLRADVEFLQSERGRLEAQRGAYWRARSFGALTLRRLSGRLAAQR